MTKVRVRVSGADSIYTTNKNRVFATRELLKTGFKLKVKSPKNIKETNTLLTVNKSLTLLTEKSDLKRKQI